MSIAEIFTLGTLSLLGCAILAAVAMLAAISGGLGKWGQLTIGHNERYCAAADAYTRRALEYLAAGKVNARLDTHWLHIGCCSFWIENKFYGYCSQAEGPQGFEFRDVRVSYRTAMRLYRVEQFLAAHGPELDAAMFRGLHL